MQIKLRRTWNKFHIQKGVQRGIQGLIPPSREGSMLYLQQISSISQDLLLTPEMTEEYETQPNKESQGKTGKRNRQGESKIL